MRPNPDPDDVKHEAADLAFWKAHPHVDDPERRSYHAQRARLACLIAAIEEPDPPPTVGVGETTYGDLAAWYRRNHARIARQLARPDPDLLHAAARYVKRFAETCNLCGQPLGDEPTVGGRWSHERCQADRIRWRAEHPNGEPYPEPAAAI